MNAIATPGQDWNTHLYEQNHAFVWRYGEDLLRLLTPQPGERVLDLGCGTGQLTAQIAAMGAEVVGLDASAEMIGKAQTNYPELSFVVADGRNFRVEQPFDAVFSNATLHWICNPDAVIHSVWSALKPQGRFVAEFGGKGNVQAIITALNSALNELGVAASNPWYFPSISDYASRLEQQGFEVLMALLFDRPTPLEGESGLANWLRMFASSFLSQLSTEEWRQVVKTVETQLRPTLYQNDTWMADYRRIQIVARRI
jgi:trans-aconitate methyltransferase